MRQNHHYNLHFERRRLPGRLWSMVGLFVLCAGRYDIFHFYFGKSLLPLNLDLPLLKLLRKIVVMTYCGSDVRLYEVESKRNPYASLMTVGIDEPRFDGRKKRKMAWQRIWVDRFTAVRNLYASAVRVIPAHKIERNIWVNNSMDLSAYIPTDYRTNEVPLIIHAPSEVKIKGTEYVEKAVEALRREGYRFEYRRLQGVANEEAQRIYREEADIIVDQLLAGGFGTLAVEGMYYCKPVCCYLIDQVLQWYPDCLIVNCNIDNLKEKLTYLIQHPEERTRLGREGRQFVDKHCSRDHVNQQIWDMYRELTSG